MHPDLVRVVALAIEHTSVDFMVIEGVRSRERQAELVKAGASQTMNSRHITGHAVDLGAVVDGSLRWDWPLYPQIARAMQRASREAKVPVRWGGCWQLLSTFDDPEEAVAAYTAQRRAQGRRAFLDGPHFELPADRYPA
ncbi:M15 family metallopeptidase [Methylibium sp.]|uniref:M15 family metallopeptidase n=1 Tax=Methylibium sp. TaxID=2067992 RepID=UPI0033424CEB